MLDFFGIICSFKQRIVYIDFAFKSSLASKKNPHSEKRGVRACYMLMQVADTCLSGLPLFDKSAAYCMHLGLQMNRLEALLNSQTNEAERKRSCRNGALC